MELENKKIKYLERNLNTTTSAKKFCEKNGINFDSLKKYSLGDYKYKKIRSYYYTNLEFEEFEELYKDIFIKKYGKLFEIKEIKTVKKIKKPVNLKVKTKTKICTRCKNKFVTEVDKFGIAFDTRCKKCKKSELRDKEGRLNGRLGKIGN